MQRTVQAAMEFIPKLEGDTKLALIDTLISVRLTMLCVCFVVIDVDIGRLLFVCLV